MDELFGKYFVPIGVKRAMLEDPILGVCVAFKNKMTSKWYSMGFCLSEYGLDRISNLVLSGKYSDFEHDYMILDSYGNVCASNCKEEVVVDDYIRVGKKHMIKVVRDERYPQYVCGDSEYEIDTKIDRLVKDKKIKRPKDMTRKRA